jgi:hypothetical protein
MTLGYDWGEPGVFYGKKQRSDVLPLNATFDLELHYGEKLILLLAFLPWSRVWKAQPFYNPDMVYF